jgi:Ran GTPase-activating protein (RanGAP) involved in mRNA processing and transport
VPHKLSALPIQGVVALAHAMRDMRALAKFDISSNILCMAGAKALVAALEGNTIMTDLNLASNWLGCDQPQFYGSSDMSGVIALAEAIPDMGALLHFDISNNGLYAAGAKAIAEGLEGNQVVRQLNISVNGMGKISEYGHPDISGVAALADVIPGMGALSIANVMGNHIGKEMLSKLQEIMRSKPNLISLCGIADDATEADLSGLRMDADDAIVLASELPDKRALTKFIFSGYDESESVTMETTMTVADFSDKGLGVSGATMLSAFLPKCT